MYKLNISNETMAKIIALSYITHHDTSEEHKNHDDLSEAEEFETCFRKLSDFPEEHIVDSPLYAAINELPYNYFLEMMSLYYLGRDGVNFESKFAEMQRAYPSEQAKRNGVEYLAGKMDLAECLVAGLLLL
jgi:hypothetical protein